MAGLLILIVLIAWLVFCLKISAVLGGAAKSQFLKVPLVTATFAGLLVAPIADDLLGTRQYERYCQAGDKVEYHRTISVPREVGLFAEDGAWQVDRLKPSDHDERLRLNKLAESFVRWDTGITTPTKSIFPIQERKTEIHEASSGELLAEWKSYHFKGGFLRRSLFDSASQCFPKDFHDGVYRRLFVLKQS